MPEVNELYVTTAMAEFTQDEIDVIEIYLTRLPYRQSLTFGATFIDADDPLLSASHNEIDQLEQNSGSPATRHLPGGGERSVYERVLLIREHGYLSVGQLALPPQVDSE